MKHLFLKRPKLSSYGFTLVETLVAISLLMVVIIGPMTIAAKGMRNAYYAGDQTTAIYLAQEAIEHMQRLRDDVALVNFADYRSNGTNGNGDTWSWYTGLNSNCKDGDGCDVNLNDSPASYLDCSTPTNCILNKYTGTGVVDRVYGYSTGAGWQSSIFTRRIRVGGINNWGVPVTVTVSWNSTLFGSVRTVTLQTFLYDVYERYE